MTSILAAGCLWGTMGFFRRRLGELGIDSFGVVLVRCALAAAMYALFCILRDPSALKIRLKDAWCFIGSGIVSLLFFSACYFRAMTLMSLSAAAVLLYTAPCFVMLMSAVLFGEKITGRKIAAMILAFAGCCLVSGISGGTGISAKGLLFGLGSGIGYALYSIFGRYALDRGYKSVTVSFYSCALAAAGAALICASSGSLGACTGAVFASAGSLLFCLAAAFITTFLPYLLYTYGLSCTEAGIASVAASIEPVVATLVGILIFKEALSLSSAAGMLLVLAAIALLATGKRIKN